MTEDLDPQHSWALLEIAQTKSRKLSVDERRLVVAHIIEHGLPDENGKLVDPSNCDLAMLFGVNESQIRSDKKRIYQEYAAAITPEDAMGLVSAFLVEHNALIRRAKTGLAACAPGTMGHWTYLKQISELEKRKIEMLQSCGLVPKELGALTVNEEHWVAYVLPDGTTGNRPMPSTEDAELAADTNG
jgi:hypothetical protein